MSKQIKDITGSRIILGDGLNSIENTAPYKKTIL